ncbi:MAG: DUF3107 domain-containing protein [Acidimicrobiales bacterium]
MDVRIGIADSPQIIEVEMDDGTDRDALRSEIEAVLAGKNKILWVTDRKGKELAVPSEQIAFVELGTSDAERKIGFGA